MTPLHLDWPARALPALRVAGMFPLRDRDFGHTYQSPTHALHLYDYHGTIRLGTHEHRLSPGTLTLSPADAKSWYDLPEPGTHWCIHFSPIVDADGPMLRLPLVIDLGSRASDAAVRFARIARLHQLTERPHPHPATSTAASVAMAELLNWVGLLDVPSGQATPDSPDVIQLLADHIDRNPHRDHSASNLATTVGLSSGYVARLFHRHHGMTIARYALTRRIELAKMLLLSTRLPIKQIAIRVGVTDAQHFNKQFRTVAGLSPTAYREQGS